MYNNPKRFEVKIDNFYKLEVDVDKADCNREAPHWHLVWKGDRIGQIFTNPVRFEKEPKNLQTRILNEALELTERYRDEIRATYLHNKDHGAGY